MKENKHVEHKRIVDGADKAVLLIHGILSTPNHFRDLIPMIPQEYSVYAMVTAGHCATAGDFSRSSMEKWEQSVQRSMDELLKNHKEIYIVGHSMGTLFAIEQAIKEPRVKGLFCISVPIKVGVRLRMIGMATRIYLKRIKPDDIYTLACKESYGCTDTKNIFRYLGWIPRFFDLFRKIAEVRKSLDKLKTPCVAYQSRLDELVSPKSADILKNESKMKVVMLENSTHFHYDKPEMEMLQADFMKFLGKI